MSSQSVLSTQNVRVLVSPDPVGGQPYNPTADPVQMAFMLIDPATQTSASPASGDWHAASWYMPAAGVYMAQCLVGPANGGVVLAAGDYTVWAKVIDYPEVPIDSVGILTIEP